MDHMQEVRNKESKQHHKADKNQYANTHIRVTYARGQT